MKLSSFLLCSYRKEFIACCEELSKIGLEEKVKRDKELASFKAAHKDACKKNQELSVEKFKEYGATKQKVGELMNCIESND